MMINCVFSFQSIDTLKAVAEIANGERIWTGGYRESGGSSPWTGKWKWSDNSDFVSYTDLSNGHQPPSGSYMGKEELNIEVYGGYLNDRNGEDKLPFVCKLRLVLSNIWSVTSLCLYIPYCPSIGYNKWHFALLIQL